MTDDMLKADELWARMVKAREEYKKNKNKPKSVCVSCEKELERGGFAYNQELCWSCVQEEIDDILDYIKGYYHEEQATKLIKWLTEITAAHYHLPRPIF